MYVKFEGRNHIVISDKPIEDIMEIDGGTSIFWLNQWMYKHQRDLSMAHVNELAQAMENGEFTQKTQIAFCKCEGYHLVNGQHTLRAIHKCGIPQMLDVVIHECETMKDVADIYARYDIQRRRNISDSIRAHQVCETLNMTPTQLRIIRPGAVLYASMIGDLSANKHAGEGCTLDEQLATIIKYQKLETKIINLIAGNQKKKYLIRKTTIACMMYTTGGNEPLSKDFWEGIINDDGLKKGDPRKTILELLKESSVRNGSRRSVNKHPYSNIELIKAISLSWNAFHKKVKGDGSSRELTRIQIKSCNQIHFNFIGSPILPQIQNWH